MADKAAEETVVETATGTAEESGVPKMQYRGRRAEMLRGTVEHREVTLSDMECRALDDGTLRMSGIASVTEHFYDVGDPERSGFRERIRRNAFRNALAEKPDVSLLGNHEGWPMASTRNDSLTLKETPAGLHWAADLDPEDPESRVIARKVERGLLKECSFAFLCRDDEWNEDFSERTIKSLSLHRGDVSIVTHGANEATSVTLMRSADGQVELRAGMAISAARQTALQGVLDRIAKADTELDAAQPELAQILGVDNPDADDMEPDADDAARAAEPVEESREAEAPPAPTPAPAPAPIPDYTTRALERVAALRRVA